MVCGRSLDDVCRGLPFFITLLVLLLCIWSMIQGAEDSKGRRNMRKKKCFVHFYQDILKVHSTDAFFYFPLNEHLIQKKK